MCQSCLDFWERVGQAEGVIGSSRAMRLAVGWAPRLKGGRLARDSPTGRDPFAHLISLLHTTHTTTPMVQPWHQHVEIKIPLRARYSRPAKSGPHRRARAVSPLPPSSLTIVFVVARRCRPVPSQFSKPTIPDETSVIATHNRLAGRVGPVGCSNFRTAHRGSGPSIAVSPPPPSSLPGFHSQS